jgi:hypothetical protein
MNAPEVDARAIGLSLDDRLLIAIHEAGHAVAAYALGWTVDSLSLPLVAAESLTVIFADGQTRHGAVRGDCVIGYAGGRRRAAWEKAVIALAGPMAELMVGGDLSRGGVDFHLARSIARSRVSEREVAVYVERAAGRALRLLRRHRLAVAALAEALHDAAGHLDGPVAIAIIETEIGRERRRARAAPSRRQGSPRKGR